MPNALNHHENEIADLEKRLPDSPTHPVAFYGSSSIRLWESLDRDFPDVPVMNLGFGGSTTPECVYYFDRLITPIQPRAVVLYAGDNDIGQDYTPEAVAASFGELHSLIEMRLGPDMPLLFLSIKPSLARWHLRDAIKEANALIGEQIAARPRSTYVDLWPSMIDADGAPRPELFADDGLHVNAQGYALWRDALTNHRSGNF